MLTREIKGRDIAARGTIAPDGVYWRVPSQAGTGWYTVDLTGETPHCTCPDYELSGLKCKHIYAVEYTLAPATPDASTSAEPSAEPPEAKRTRRTYPQDWPAYNAAQTNEKAHFLALLHDLCRGIEEPAYTYGRPRLPLADMLFAAAFKVYSTVSCRRFMTDLADA